MERSLLKWLAETAGAPGGAIVGIGDDAAVLERPVSGPLVATTDQVIEGIHFVLERPGFVDSATAAPGRDLPAEARLASLAEVGRKAVARCLSDLAAMAARPWFTLLSVALPRALGERDARALLIAALDEGQRLGAPVGGGDLSESAGGIMVAVTGLGLMEGRRAWVRSGARAGDCLVVTGRLGGSLLGRHLALEPRIEEARAIAAAAEVHAAIDISDGLLIDASRIAQASGVRLVIDLQRIPVSREAERMADVSGGTALDHALRDGEDHELLLAMPPEDLERAAGAVAPEVGVRVIGRCESGPAGVADSAGRALEIGGHEHLRD